MENLYKNEHFTKSYNFFFDVLRKDSEISNFEYKVIEFINRSTIGYRESLIKEIATRYLAEGINAKQPQVVRTVTKLLKLGILKEQQQGRQTRILGINFEYYRQRQVVGSDNTTLSVSDNTKLSVQAKTDNTTLSKKEIFKEKKERKKDTHSKKRNATPAPDSKLLENKKRLFIGKDIRELIIRSNLADQTKEALQKWYQYKAELKTKIVPTQVETLIQEVIKIQNKNDIPELVNEAIAKGWNNFLFADRLAAPPQHKPPTNFSNSTDGRHYL